MQERELVVENRTELIWLLYQAAGLEHALMCEYLFAAFSMKRSTDEGVTAEQLAAMEGWRATILDVAVQEMLHLALASNLLTALGAAPTFGRPNFPVRSRWFPPHVQVELMPFSERALQHFLYLERPEGMELDDAPGFVVEAPAPPPISPDELIAADQDFLTVGHLYRGIERGFTRLVERHGAEAVFIGPTVSQATPDAFGFPELRPVTDLDGACAAVETIVEQGEGARGDWEQAHYGRFLRIQSEFTKMRAEHPEFEPARPVLPAVVRQPHDVTERLPRIMERPTARMVDIFNVAYEVLLLMLGRFFARTVESAEQQEVLGDAAITLMRRIMSPLGEAITTMPVGPHHPGMTAGPSFELYYTGTYLLPHHRPAWLFMAERLRELATACRALDAEQPIPFLSRLARRLDDLAATLTDHVD